MRGCVDEETHEARGGGFKTEFHHKKVEKT
jgi:hypothetical protein